MLFGQTTLNMIICDFSVLRRGCVVDLPDWFNFDSLKYEMVDMFIISIIGNLLALL